MAIKVVSFRCTLRDKLGRLISSTFNQNVLTSAQNSQSQLKALSDALSDLRKGEKREICLRADEAYGFYNLNLVIVRPRDEISANGPIRLGEQVVFLSNGEKKSYRVTELTDESVTLDGNHPLAGQDLIFEIEAINAREATEEEIADASIGERITEETIYH